MEDKVKRVISTLNNVEVRGKSNLDMVLGCIMVLEDVMRELSNENKKEVTEDG